MPHCENTVCNKKLHPEHVREAKSGQLLCSECLNDVTPLHGEKPPAQLWGRDFGYDFGYTRQRGIYAGASLGGAKLSLEVSQEELTRTFGPPKS